MKYFNYKTTSFNNLLDSKKTLDSDYIKSQSSNIRVICKNILYLIGIPYEIANIFRSIWFNSKNNNQ